MPDGQPPPVARTWVIHSVVVRTRDGPQRLDQVYRHLLQDRPPEVTASEGALLPTSSPRR